MVTFHRADCWTAPPKRSELTHVTLWYILRHGSHITPWTLCFMPIVSLRRQRLEKVLCHLSHKPETEIRKGFTSVVSLHLLWGRDFPPSFPYPKHSSSHHAKLLMVLGHLFYYIYYYSLHNREFMFFYPFPLQSFIYWGRDFPASFPWGYAY